MVLAPLALVPVDQVLADQAASPAAALVGDTPALAADMVEVEAVVVMYLVLVVHAVDKVVQVLFVSSTVRSTVLLVNSPAPTWRLLRRKIIVF